MNRKVKNIKKFQMKLLARDEKYISNKNFTLRD